MGLGFNPKSIFKSLDPVGDQTFRPKEQGGMGLPDPLNLYGFGQSQMQAAPTATDAPPPPSLITPTAIATDSDKKQAQRRMQATALSRKGRASTILSDTLG